jgi:hypothetical protein
MRRSNRITVSIALAMIASSLVLAVPAGSAVAGLVKVSERISNPSPLASATIRVSVCWTGAQRGDVVELEKQSLASLALEGGGSQNDQHRQGLRTVGAIIGSDMKLPVSRRGSSRTFGRWNEHRDSGTNIWHHLRRGTL